jgi:ubiquinone/menaquinone biosynthesis C-methylase UbiE
MNLNEHEAWNERMAARYDPDAFITRSGAPVRWMEALRLRKTRVALQVTDQLDVLDVGCGSGNLLAILKGRRTVGFDLSEQLLAKARQRLQKRSDVELVKGFAESLPFPAGSFDRIICSEVLEHVREPEKVIAEIRRVAKPGARIVITLPNETLINFVKKIVIALGLKKFFAGDYPMSDNMLSEWHVGEIEPEWVENACKGRFEILAVRSCPFFLAPFHRLFVLKAI